MKYEKTVSGIFIDRPNRFIAHVEIDGKTETVHVKNTGRCKELLIPGVKVIMEDFRNRPGYENRKTQFDLIAVYKKTDKEPLLINMDSQAPNKVVFEWLNSLPEAEKYNVIKPEYTFGNSRIDFYMERNMSAIGDRDKLPNDGDRDKSQKFLMEVKGCTLEKDGTGYFPDAPTERGVKHLYELAEASKNGYKAILAFVIQIPGVKTVLPNLQTHAEFGKALEVAKTAGVQILYLQCNVTENSLRIIK